MQAIVNLKKQIKKIIMKPINFIAGLLTDLLLKILKDSKSDIASELSILREHSINENEELQLTKYLVSLQLFYSVDIMEKYTGKNRINELQLRKNEIKNQMNFMFNVYLGLGTGILAGLIANNIHKLKFVFYFESSSIARLISNLIIVLLYIFILFFFPFLIVRLYKYLTTFRDPVEIAIEEFELNIIDNLIKSEFDSRI